MYQGHFGDTPIEQRQNILQEVFHFRCQCVACVNDFPLMKDSPSTYIEMASLFKNEESIESYFWKIKDKIEYYSTVRTQNAIFGCNVALVLIDAEKGFGKQDKSIVDLVISKGKALIFIVNKWDKIEKSTNTMKDFTDEVRYQFRELDHYPVLFISSTTKQRINKVLETSWSVYERTKNTIQTNKLNTVIEKTMRENPPPAEKGKVIKVNYSVQVHKQPVVIALFSNYPKLIKVPYQRFLINQIRSSFDLNGIPIRLSIRKK